MKTYPIPVNLLNAIASYLAEKPWKEVNNLIAGLNDATKEPEVPKAESKDGTPGKVGE